MTHRVVASCCSKRISDAGEIAMKLQKFVSPTFHAVAATTQTVARFAKLERILAFVCLFTPALLIWSDDGPIRSSFCAYYIRRDNQRYHFAFTVASFRCLV